MKNVFLKTIVQWTEKLISTPEDVKLKENGLTL